MFARQREESLFNTAVRFRFGIGVVTGVVTGCPIPPRAEIEAQLITVASKPRVGCYSQARTPQLVWASWRETQLGRHSWTGTSYSHETGSRLTGFSFVYKYLLVPSRIDSNKQCFHNQYMHTCLLRATITALLGDAALVEDDVE